MVGKLTLFEAHFDGAHLGPSFGDADDETVDEHESGEYGRDESPDVSTDEASGSRLRPVLAALGVIAVGAVVARSAVPRMRNRGETDVGEFGVEDVDGREEPAVR